MTLNFEESIIIGSFAISGSDITRCKNSTIAFSESNKPSSILMSMTCAPPSTCDLATSKAAVKSPCFMSRAKALEPVTFVRSPTLMKFVFSRTNSGSRPEYVELPLSFTGLRGLTPLTASAIARTWSGVVPQQPPTIFKNPLSANSRINTCICSAV